jgi:hypothetical protein
VQVFGPQTFDSRKDNAVERHPGAERNGRENDHLGRRVGTRDILARIGLSASAGVEQPERVRRRSDQPRPSPPPRRRWMDRRGWPRVVSHQARRSRDRPRLSRIPDEGADDTKAMSRRSFDVVASFRKQTRDRRPDHPVAEQRHGNIDRFNGSGHASEFG